MQELWQYKPFRVFVRQVFNGFITLLLAYLAGIEGELVAMLPILYALINATTKYINNTYFADLGVVK